jgi:CO/xanthine dehydrogenase Mo-binding subunit
MNLAFRLASGGGADGGPALPGSLRVNPRLSRWLEIRPDGMVEVRPGKVEIGQGILTALAQIAAEELEVSTARIVMAPARTDLSPDEGMTSGSLSIQESGTALRHACAEARALLLDAAARRLGTPVAALAVSDGDIVAPDGTRTSYWAFAAEKLLERDATAGPPPKSSSAYRIVGQALPRLDLPDKVYGRPRFVHDLDLPGMMHGRVLRPPSPAAALDALDDTAARGMSGVAGVVRDGSFVGVLAEREHAAVTALEQLRRDSTWREPASLPDERDIAVWLKSRPAEMRVVDERAPTSAVPARRTRRARYSRPFLAHASIGPSCAVAQWAGSRLHVWTHSQGIYNLRADLALALHMRPEDIVVEHMEGAGCYGHNGADDVALDAALLARAAGARPVRVQWSREDELAWSPFGPAMAVELEADLDGEGAIVAWRHEVWSNGHSTRPGRAQSPTLLAARHLAQASEPPAAINPPLAAGGGAERNAVPLYDFPARRIVSHRVLDMPIRTSALRSLGAFVNVFAIESFIDELAAELGVDAVAYRLRYLRDPRARAVIEAAAARAGWGRQPSCEGYGRGIGFARYKNTGAYCAVVAEVEVERDVRARRLVIAADAGLAINPDGIANQLEGGAIQATSWTLKEAVRFDRTRITSASWGEYPILRFSEIPAVEIELLSRPDAPPLGAGEAAQGPTAAAIGNAVRDALGMRVRDLPITPERVVSSAD